MRLLVFRAANFAETDFARVLKELEVRVVITHDHIINEVISPIIVSNASITTK